MTKKTPMHQKSVSASLIRELWAMDSRGLSIHSGPKGNGGNATCSSGQACRYCFCFLPVLCPEYLLDLPFCVSVNFSGWFYSFWNSYLSKPGPLRSTSVLFLLILSVPQNCPSSTSLAWPCNLNSGPFYRVAIFICPVFLLKHVVSYIQCLCWHVRWKDWKIRHDFPLRAFVDTQYSSVSWIRVRVIRCPKHWKDYGISSSHVIQNKIK